MPKPLTNEQLAEIDTWPLPKLFWRYERTVAINALIGNQYQNTSNPHKSPSDPDVAQMLIELDALKDELLSRIGKRYKGELATWESAVATWEICLASINGCYGVPQVAWTDEQVATFKSQLQTTLDALPSEVQG
jgi:hypothetical protein